MRGDYSTHEDLERLNICKPKDKQKDSEESLDSYMVTLQDQNWNTSEESLERIAEQLGEILANESH